ncbi:MAG: type III-B CRISPR module-associated protein Cmr3 [Thermodesulfobacteriota bacterium]
MERIGLILKPLDVLFFRDGRPLEASLRVPTGLPLPQTLAGALRTWMLKQTGCDFNKLGESLKQGLDFSQATTNSQPKEVALAAQVEFRGPWFAKSEKPLVPVPANIVGVGTEDGEIQRLDPLSPQTDLPGWEPPEPGMKPLWRRDIRPAKRLSGYLGPEGLKAFLEGGIPTRRDICKATDLFAVDHRTGIEINPDSLTTKEGQIYGLGLLALKQDVTFYAEVLGPDEALQMFPSDWTTLPWGGEGRQVAIRKYPAWDWPRAKPKNGQGVLLLLTTPALFADAWRSADLKPTAAAIPDNEAVSGWDLALSGPKPTRFTVAAGSVYFLSEPLPAPVRMGEDTELGWGTFLEGRWNYV